jgi:uncharacterized membrane protein
MINIYINFITGKFSILKTYEYLFMIFICVLFLSILVSFFISIKLISRKNIYKKKLIKKEKLLIKLKYAYKNGQINAKEYKERIFNLIKDDSL